MRVLALAVLLPGFALGAVETTTVNGKALQPNGLPATSGTITCSLSQPGSALDGATWQRIAGQAVGTIAADGTVTGLVFVPNDVISPSGTVYLCTYSVRSSTGRPITWSETLRVDSLPDPVNIGAIVRVAPPGATFVAGPQGPIGPIGPTGPTGPSVYDVMLSWIGRPIANEVLARIEIAHAFIIPSGCTGSQASVGTNPTAQATVTVKKNGADAGTVTIATNGTASFTCASPISLGVSDLLSFHAQATADATLADLSITLTGAP